MNDKLKMLSKLDKFRFCIHAGILGACTQLGGVMAQGSLEDININVLIGSTIVAFLMHYSKEAKNFIADKIDKSKD